MDDLPLNKNARGKKARANKTKSEWREERKGRRWWKNRMFDRWCVFNSQKTLVDFTLLRSRLFQPSAASRVKNTVTFIAHTGRCGRKKIPTVRFRVWVLFIHFDVCALIFIWSGLLHYHKNSDIRMTSSCFSVITFYINIVQSTLKYKEFSLLFYFEEKSM